VSNRRLTSRDFKGAHRGAFSLLRWREFLAGLALGLIVALVVYVSDHRTGRDAPAALAATRGAGAPTAAIDPAAPSTSASDFSFYSRLPNTQVVLPERERPAATSAGGRIDKPGTYWLQVGAWRDFDQAERTRASLARQDINAAIQRVAIDDDVWHRVRVGPIRDLAELERVRTKLEAAEYKPVVMRSVSD
jgi:cell division septation protein DedD